jgi:hypothetical protein
VATLTSFKLGLLAGIRLQERVEVSLITPAACKIVIADFTAGGVTDNQVLPVR